MKRFVFVLLGVCLMAQVYAQPAKRRVQPTQTGTATVPKSSDRASLQFPTAVAMPEDVVWRRDIYRQLDLTSDKNAPLYYPVEPVGDQVNLFTYIFQLLLDRKISAYEYRLDGNETFTEDAKIKVKDFLDRYRIYYETKDGRYQVGNSDIPSAEVKRYYIKESSYFDQSTSTFRTKVVALCPILIRSDFGDEGTNYPLFWLKYDEISPYLAKHQMMGSNYNNVSNTTADDYFTLNRYDGKIYKTNNMQGQVLATYCKTDSALAKEQKRIEGQLADFEKNIWKKIEEKKDTLDSLAVTDSKSAKRTREKTTTTSSSRRRSSSSRVSSSKSKSSSKSSSAPRVSVRRQRR